MLEAIKSQPPEIIPRLCSEDSTCVAVDCGCYNRNLGNNTSHRIYTELRTGDGILRIHAHLRRQATSLQSRLVTTTTRKVGTVASGIAALEDPGTGRKSEESSCCWEADSLKTAIPTRIPAAKKTNAIRSQMTPQTWDGKHPHIRANAEASELFTLREMVSSITSQRTYKSDITPMNRIKYRRATPPPTNQNRTIRPDIPMIRAHVNQFFRAHHSVNRKNAARTRHATLLALVSNPHAIKQAPMSEEPRYPAGRVIQGIPPDIRVSPPSSGSSSTE
jgi:hypothetical protein